MKSYDLEITININQDPPATGIKQFAIFTTIQLFSFMGLAECIILKINIFIFNIIEFSNIEASYR